MVKGKIVEKIKVAELKSSELSPVIPQTPVETIKTLVEPIMEVIKNAADLADVVEPIPVEPPVMDEHKAKRERKSAKSETSAKPVFPLEAFINKYGFIHITNGVAQAFGITGYQKQRNVPITIDFKEGALIIRKA